MIENRVFVVIREVEDGLTVTLTPLDPPFPVDGVVAAFRVPGATRGETVLHFPGGSAVQPATIQT